MSGLQYVSRTVLPVPSLKKRLTQLDQYFTSRFARLSDEALFRDRQNELMIRLSGVEVAVGSMTTKLMALGRKVARFGTSILELVRAQIVPPRTRLHQARSTTVGMKGGISRWMRPCRGVARPSRNFPYPQAFFDAGQESPKQETLSALSSLVTTAKIPHPISQEVEVVGIAPYLGPYAPGLGPVQTLLSSFATVVVYRLYRLADTTPVPAQTYFRCMFMSKTQSNGLSPTLGLIFKFEPIEVLSFLAIMKEGLEALGKRKVSPLVFFRISSWMMRNMCIRPLSRWVHAPRR